MNNAQGVPHRKLKSDQRIKLMLNVGESEAIP